MQQLRRVPEGAESGTLGSVMTGNFPHLMNYKPSNLRSSMKPKKQEENNSQVHHNQIQTSDKRKIIKATSCHPYLYGSVHTPQSSKISKISCSLRILPSEQLSQTKPTLIIFQID